MSHTNETTYYNLPQYVGSDIINPLVDTNGAYEQIDTVMHNIATAANGAVTDASDAKTAVENMESTVSGHTTAIEANTEAIADVSGVIAPNFDSSESYSKDDIVIYTDGKSYQFTANHSGAWTGLDVERVIIGEEITKIKLALSHVGMIIHSTTLASEADVKAVYGSNTSWIQHVGYILRGANSNVTDNDNTNIGDGFNGSDDAIVPYHTHTCEAGGEHNHAIGVNAIPAADGSGGVTMGSSGTSGTYIGMDGIHSHTIDPVGTVGNIIGANKQRAKNVYIWERIA